MSAESVFIEVLCYQKPLGESLSTRIDALEEFDQVAARSREFLSQDRSEEARAEYARYRQRLDGSAALALVAHRIEEHEKALEDPESLVRIRNAIRRGDVVEIPGDSPFAADALRAKAVELYQAKDHEGCLATLARIEPSTPSDALLKASCRSCRSVHGLSSGIGFSDSL